MYSLHTLTLSLLSFHLPPPPASCWLEDGNGVGNPIYPARDRPPIPPPSLLLLSSFFPSQLMATRCLHLLFFPILVAPATKYVITNRRFLVMSFSLLLSPMLIHCLSSFQRLWYRLCVSFPAHVHHSPSG